MNYKSKATGEVATLVQQNYIEVIADLIRLNGQARTCDIAARLRISLPSVTEAVHRLASSGLVHRKSRHEIVLTPQGCAIADQLDSRQKALHHFMTDILGFKNGEAERLACELEHYVNARFVESLLVLDSFMDDKENSHIRKNWEHFRCKHSPQSIKAAKR